MQKTTVYLPDDIKAALTRAAQRRGISEAEIIRAAVQHSVGAERPRPRGGLYRGKEPNSERADELLAGFGER